MMYNEAFLVPLFMRHYAPWVDKVTVLYSESVDETRQELESAAAVCHFYALNIIPYEFTHGFNDAQKIDRINKAIRESTADFVVCVDADEFVHPWPFESTNPRNELEKECGNVIYCKMYQSYRHSTDRDIDRSAPPLFQRRHGATEFFINLNGENVLLKDIYTKPCIVRPDCGPQFEAGCHKLVVSKRGATTWRGVHWGKADDFCLLRYVRDRAQRMSEYNRSHGIGVQHFDATEERITAELEAHRNDPKLF